MEVLARDTDCRAEGQIGESGPNGPRVSAKDPLATIGDENAQVPAGVLWQSSQRFIEPP